MSEAITWGDVALIVAGGVIGGGLVVLTSWVCEMIRERK
jgi:hypothetical protein